MCIMIIQNLRPTNTFINKKILLISHVVNTAVGKHLNLI
jgi:hypothetical protein